MLIALGIPLLVGLESFSRSNGRREEAVSATADPPRERDKTHMQRRVTFQGGNNCPPSPLRKPAGRKLSPTLLCQFVQYVPWLLDLQTGMAGWRMPTCEIPFCGMLSGREWMLLGRCVVMVGEKIGKWPSCRGPGDQGSRGGRGKVSWGRCNPLQLDGTTAIVEVGH